MEYRPLTPGRPPPPRLAGPRAEASRPAESVLLPAQERRDVEMLVFRNWRTRNGPGVWVGSAGRLARRLLARLGTGEGSLSRRRDVRPVKRRHRRRGCGGGWRRCWLVLMARDAERRQFLQQRPAARFRDRNGALT